jgi:hypothetical protein
MKMTILILVVLFALPVFAQQHAPTIDVCRADFAVWKAEMNNQTRAVVTKKLSYTELTLRSKEMGQCVQVDWPSETASKDDLDRIALYDALAGVYLNEISDREANFIRRHSLSEQFIAEDEAGQR